MSEHHSTTNLVLIVHDFVPLHLLTWKQPIRLMPAVAAYCWYCRTVVLLYRIRAVPPVCQRSCRTARTASSFHATPGGSSPARSAHVNSHAGEGMKCGCDTLLPCVTVVQEACNAWVCNRIAGWLCISSRRCCTLRSFTCVWTWAKEDSSTQPQCRRSTTPG